MYPFPSHVCTALKAPWLSRSRLMTRLMTALQRPWFCACFRVPWTSLSFPSCLGTGGFSQACESIWRSAPPGDSPTLAAGFLGARWWPSPHLRCGFSAGGADMLPGSILYLHLSSSFIFPPVPLGLDLKKIGGSKVICVERSKRCQSLLCLTWF